MLNRFEWDFRQVPADQIEECWIYEFSRERPDLADVIEDWREELSGARDFRSLMQRAGGRKTGIISVRDRLCFVPIGAYFMFPEWPDQPFQEIEPGERRLRFGALLENERPIGLPQTEQAKAAHKGWKDHDGTVPNLRELEPHPRELEMMASGDSICMPSSVFDKTHISEESTDQIVLFRINWDLADKEILKSVSAWLKANRPRSPSTKGSVGGSDPLRKKKKELERLGKVRIAHFRNDDYLTDWEGKPLFADQSRWIKCRQSVKRIIDSIQVVR